MTSWSSTFNVRVRHWSQQRLRLAKKLVAVYGREEPVRVVA
jgi:hypothetical protein